VQNARVELLIQHPWHLFRRFLNQTFQRLRLST